jgi:citrate lyase beta subunit
LCLQAASEINADSIVMDCEDGVAANMKDMARQTIALMLDGEWGPGTTLRG